MTVTEQTPSEPVGVFISYSRRDEAAVVRLGQALEADGSIDVFRDKEDILPAEAWSDRLAALIRQAHAFVLCITPDAVGSQEVGREIDEALAGRKRVVPVMLLDTPTDQIPEAIRRLNFLYLRPSDPFEAGVAAVRAAVQTDIASVREHTRLAELARRWRADGRRASDQLRGPALEAAERWLAVRSRETPEPTALHLEYITASRRGATRRLRFWTAGAVVVALVTGVLGLVARWQRNEARAQRTTAQARRLIAEAESVLADPLSAGQLPSQSLLTSLALRSTDEGHQALARAVNRLEPVRVAALSWPAGAELRDLRFSPDGSRLVAATDRSIVVWSVTGRLEAQLPAKIGADRPRTVFAPDGRYAVVCVGAQGAADTRVITIDLAGGTIVPPPSDLGQVHDCAAVTERLLVLDESGGELRARDPVTGTAAWKAEVGAAAVQGARLVRGQGPEGAEVRPDVVAVDARGQLRFWRLDAKKLAPAKALPAGSQLLVIGERGRAVGVRLADGQQAVLDTLSGRELWRGAADGAAPTLAGGDRFVVTQGRQGIALQSLDGGVAAQVEPARRSDWDLTALSDVQRYSAIIDAAVSDDGAVLVTAWNDGRIDVWRPGLKPRYGAIDAVPRPNFESMARFDHGEALGATATWNAPVPLTLSPSGRFVASQSLGVATNAVGGVVAFTPKLRVWDARTGGEIARFARERPMLIAFSPRDDLAVTMTRRAAPNERETLALWRLGAEGPAVAREEISVPVPAASQGRPDARPGGAPSPADLLAAQSGSSDRVWLGVDGKLRAIDRQQRKVVVLDDLAPAFDESRTRAKQAVANLVARQDVTDEERAALRGVPGMIDKLPGPAGVGIPGLPLRHSASVDVPALPLPFTAVAVSGDGRRAVVKIGAQLRVYVLEGQRLASTIDCGDGSDLLGVVDISGELARQAPVLSYDGRFVAVSRIDTLELLRAVWNMKTRPSEPGTVRRDITVTALEGDHPSATPIARVPAYIQVGPLMTPLGAVFTASRALALSADGKLLALERRELVATANRPPRREARLTVIETRTGQLRLAAAPAPLPSPIDLDAQTAAIPWAAAFSPSGRRLVGEETRSPCPLRLVTNPRTWMPMNVPSCPQLATRLTWWDLDGASMLGSVSYERAVRSSQASKGALPRRGAALAMPNEKDVERSVVEWAEAPACDTPPCVSVHWTEERISLDRRDRLVEEACERLPPALRVLPEADWHQRLPGETPRAICAASVPQSR